MSDYHQVVVCANVGSTFGVQNGAPLFLRRAERASDDFVEMFQRVNSFGWQNYSQQSNEKWDMLVDDIELIILYVFQKCR